MFLKNKKQGRIFICYRRSDSQGYAGRLSDSLEAYFGGNRVFRDVEDIEGGAEFAKDIKTQISTADAIIILIGPSWLSTTDNDGNRRIDNPKDWVVKEIVMAFEQGVRVFPVLIEGTEFPRKEELPEKLFPILNYNAITVSDKNWEADVLGLGKIISFDVPTANERLLFRLQLLIYSVLGASLIYSAATIRNNALSLKNINPESHLISLAKASAPFYVIISSLIILSLILRLVASEKRKYIIYSLITGVIGTSFFFFGFVAMRETWNLMQESMFVFLGSVIVSILMYVFLGLSGFKPK